MSPRPLSDREIHILDIESRTWKKDGSKEQAALDELGLGWVHYHYLLSKLIESEAAEAHNPILVHRLRKLRDQIIAKKRRER